MKLLNTDETKWDKKIQLELTLRELQIIRDSIGATSHHDRSSIWEHTEVCPYTYEQGDSLFNDVMDIIKKQGGITFV